MFHVVISSSHLLVGSPTSATKNLNAIAANMIKLKWHAIISIAVQTYAIFNVIMAK